MESSKISILLPVFNAEKYLVATLESALSQTYKNWELVIVDNCSQDRTEKIVQEFVLQDKRVKYWRNSENIGFARNYNRCIELSSGEYLLLFGADDLLEPECLEKFAAVLDTHNNVVFVTCTKTLIDAESQTVGVVRRFETSRLVPAKEAIERCLVSLANWVGGAVMYRASSKRMGFDPALRMYADLDYWFRILEDGDAYYLDEMLFKYRVHVGSETSRMCRNFEASIDMIRMVDRCHEKLSEFGEDHDARSLEQVIGERLLADFIYQFSTRRDDFDAVLRPYTPQGADLAEEHADLHADVHDLRRIVFYSLLKASTLKSLVDANEVEMKTVLQKAKLMEDYLNEQRVSLKSKLGEAIAEHDHAVQERDKVSEEVRKLSLKLETSRRNQQHLEREVQRLTDELSTLKRDKGVSDEEVQRLASLLSVSETEIARILSSDSWKLTAPLRAIRKSVSERKN